jgi:CYTH domain-containing protein
MTNIYLSEAEFQLLGQLDGAVLSKTRWQWSVAKRVFSVDQFGGALEGIVLAEIELPLDAEPAAPPPLMVADVTEDDRFSGSRLAVLTRSEATDLVRIVATLPGQPIQM